MLDEKIELLFNTIKERTHQWDEYRKIFGEDHYCTKDMLNTLWGLEEAFQLISGHSYTEVLIEKCKKAMISV